MLLIIITSFLLSWQVMGSWGLHPSYDIDKITKSEEDNWSTLLRQSSQPLNFYERSNIKNGKISTWTKNIYLHCFVAVGFIISMRFGDLVISIIE